MTRRDGTLVESMGSNCKNLGKYVILGGHGIGAALVRGSASEVYLRRISMYSANALNVCSSPNFTYEFDGGDALTFVRYVL